MLPAGREMGMGRKLRKEARKTEVRLDNAVYSA